MCGTQNRHAYTVSKVQLCRSRCAVRTSGTLLTVLAPYVADRQAVVAVIYGTIHKCCWRLAASQEPRQISGRFCKSKFHALRCQFHEGNSAAGRSPWRGQAMSGCLVQQACVSSMFSMRLHGSAWPGYEWMSSAAGLRVKHVLHASAWVCICTIQCF